MTKIRWIVAAAAVAALVYALVPSLPSPGAARASNAGATANWSILRRDTSMLMASSGERTQDQRIRMYATGLPRTFIRTR